MAARRDTPEKDADAKSQPSKPQAPAKPQGPLIIAVSLNKQRVKVYDENGLYAEAPVSTGMRGHPTPMGVFSVLQKQKWHRSTIYSDAPMPYMQRITWTGIAMHAGVLPGHPASHGCIRMPDGFATRMWSWTRLGARVLVTPGEIAPESFAHSLLPTMKPAPQPAVAADAPPGAKSDKASAPRHDAMLRDDKTRTADAGVDAKQSDEAVTMSDVSAHNDVVAPDRAQDATKDTAARQSDSKAQDGPPASQAAASDAKPDGSKAPGAKEPADLRKDEARPADAAKAAAAKEGSSPISVFISLKDSRLYARQSFAPLFDSPVTIAPSDRPLGTHVFTAAVDKDDPNLLHWSVVSLPSTRSAARRKGESAPPPLADSAAEALDRISIPTDAMAKINDALSAGTSIIVSDQGIKQGETGEDTEFILSLR